MLQIGNMNSERTQKWWGITNLIDKQKGEIRYSKLRKMCKIDIQYRCLQEMGLLSILDQYKRRLAYQPPLEDLASVLQSRSIVSC